MSEHCSRYTKVNRLTFVQKTSNNVTAIDNHDNSVVGLDMAVYFFGNSYNTCNNNRSSIVCVSEGSESLSDEHPRPKRS